ncbi:hypothetical protein GA0115254_128153 [Streptomyces sp. Ncost-T10-10d]|nr:hypothetical protein GA0115254_128153 [Streptomyces sp. Ncost-T10-10d]
MKHHSGQIAYVVALAALMAALYFGIFSSG